MKTLLLLILFSFSCKAQVTEIPSNYIGEWTNLAGNDTIVITETTIRWTSNEPFAETSRVDVVRFTSSTFFKFESNERAYQISLEKVTRNKIRLHCQTLYEGYERCRDEYVKQVRVNLKQ